MSFRIFAAGSTATGGPFNVSRSGIDIGDIYDTVEALSAIASVPATARVAREGAGAAARSVATDEMVDRATPTSAHRQSVEALGRMQGAHLLSGGLEWLLANRAPLLLFIAVRGEAGLLTGTPSGTVRIRFLAGEVSPATDLFRRLNPVLNSCGMNGFGVLSAIGRVFGDYVSVAGAGVDGEHRLNIDITAT